MWDEKVVYNSKNNNYRIVKYFLSLLLLSLILGKIFLKDGFRNTRYIVSPIDVQSIELSEVEKQDIIRLGLTPKNSIKISSVENGEQIIHGRFLHITDIHPDPYYKEGSLQDEQCHSGKGNAAKYGDAILGCDSPMILMNDTIAWIKNNLKDKIDFIIWTGDNVRHDNDRRYPRSEQQIFEMNEKVSDLMYETFKNDDLENPRNMKVDLIPSLGNNDVYPHNLFAPGPTLQTRELFKIWQHYIPQSELHVFNRGAYFFQEVIPNQLAVLSINTLYLFQSNPLVDNCDKKKQPGYKLFEWLGYVLKEMRARKMKVWLSGHVPPNEKNYDISCLRKYIIWTHEYRDVIIGGLYGHMNIDHFIPLDSVAAYKSVRESFGAFDTEGNDIVGEDDYDETLPLSNPNEFGSDLDDIRIQGGTPYNKVRYMDTLRENLYANIKGAKKSGYLSERYSIAHVTASVIPTFNPGLRVWEYNITNLDNLLNQNSVKFESWDVFFTGLNRLFQKFDEYDSMGDDVAVQKKKDKTMPPKKPKDLPLGPAYLPQTFTPERYVQYYAPLEQINKGEKEFGYEIEYSTDDKLYGLKSLIVDEWIKYARKLGQPIKDDRKKKKKKNKKNYDQVRNKLEKIWREYLKNTFVSSDYENRGYG